MPQMQGTRATPRYAMILAAEIVELPRGAKLSARTSDVSRFGCYVDTMNAVPGGSKVLIRMNKGDETFEAKGRVVYVSPGLGMGICFTEVAEEQARVLESWLAKVGEEF